MGQFHARKDYFTKREGLDNYLLIYTVSGSGQLVYRNIERTLGSEQVALINCNEKHFYKTGDQGFWDFRYIHFGGTACEYYHDMINDISLSIVELLEIGKYLDEMNLLHKSSDSLIDIKFSAILTNIITEMLIKKFTPVDNLVFQQHSIFVDKVKAYIHENYKNKISLDHLSSLVNVSKYHMLRVFKKLTGVSPYEYIVNYRISAAKLLLKDGGYNVGEASIEVGYNDVNNFIRDFKKYIGTTPLKYKNYWIS
jgi:AraC-like DNA-binding protein